MIAINAPFSTIFRFDIRNMASLVKFGVSFSPAGLLTPFHVGASARLRSLGFIHDDIALSGSSGGALAAISSALSLSPEKTMEASLYVAQECRDKGARLTLRTSLETVLDSLLPKDCYIELNQRPQPCTVGYRELSTNKYVLQSEPKFVKQYQSKADVIEVLLASCNIPFYFNGNSVTTSVRGSQGIDGFFSVDLKRFGCPPTDATLQEVLVCPYPTNLVGLDPKKLRVDSNASNTCNYDIISPDLLDSSTWPYSLWDLLRMSLTAPASTLNPDKPISNAELQDKYQELYHTGYEAASRWYEQKVLFLQMQKIPK